MRKNFGAKPLCYPQPVFIIATYDGNGTPDAMNAAWGGISESDEISLCLSAGHKTVKNILEHAITSDLFRATLFPTNSQKPVSMPSSRNSSTPLS